MDYSLGFDPRQQLFPVVHSTRAYKAGRLGNCAATDRSFLVGAEGWSDTLLTSMNPWYAWGCSLCNERPAGQMAM